MNAVVGATLFLGERRVSNVIRWVGAAVATVVVRPSCDSSRGTAFRQPTIELINAKGGTVYESTEDEIAAVQAGKLGRRRRSGSAARR